MSKVKLSLYRKQFDFIKYALLKDQEHGMESVAKLACATHIPCIVIYHYAKEIFGETPEILDGINKNMEYYNYEGVEE